ncbi:hypothetical protein [Sulfolobus acidocaldarius]|uniref:Conserved protein n=4 Tax=Sulfolobus acidocaldarius TaxID=2285 RepID=Q4JA48_SULAC|nr:hypothetical protein [Sulfolobus acidocaldarius]AHC51306.1 hypothetical protein SUSAZ_04460 [Sulfolobus acidocaldarius SUSAZ]AAY80332.1 conserved protein [Sulfolobus acidocaldarius DSM 639]AGE70913.1 hypothetical protein SacN8_04710 [Sulfolobus acidocaldarius N8]AGE73184.1 hypothetical protein SacRon12I_04700 [Sulfolobus acidocaldarius Ron12/I]ALU28780.1 hypothetical protein ATY89_01595 [Sulfolobus acidocaldarius]
MDSGISITAEKLVEVTTKYASKISVKDEEIERLVGISMRNIAKTSVQRVSFWLVEERGNLLYCKLCNKGPFTKKGLYLHLLRLHKDEIKALIEDELKHEIKAIL